MDSRAKKTKILSPHIAVPQEHGAWVFLLSPLLIGIFTSQKFSPDVLFVILGALSSFCLRQPVTIAVKAYSGRRSKRDIPAAWFWIGVYAMMALINLGILMLKGYPFILYSLFPAMVVFAWHLYLVSRRAERRKAGIEVVGSGVLAFGAPAAYWVNSGEISTTGWVLFALVWLQSAASIVHAYMRLQQREWESLPPRRAQLRNGWRAVAYTSFNLTLVTALSLFNFLPGYLPLVYLIQFLETIYGIVRPAIGQKPTRIGLRQLIVSAVFTLCFIVAWNLT